MQEVPLGARARNKFEDLQTIHSLRGRDLLNAVHDGKTVTRQRAGAGADADADADGLARICDQLPISDLMPQGW